MQRLFHTEFFIVILLVVFFPIGIHLMWKNEIFDEPVRIVITGFFTLLLMATIGLGVFSLHGEHFWVAYYVH